MPLKVNKALGPDGYSAGFFNRARSVVGSNVMYDFKGFLRSSPLLRAANSIVSLSCSKDS